jgi:hypothetical protein
VKTANDTVVMIAEIEERYASNTGRLEPEAILDETRYFLALSRAQGSSSIVGVRGQDVER